MSHMSRALNHQSKFAGLSIHVNFDNGYKPINAVSVVKNIENKQNNYVFVLHATCILLRFWRG